MASYHWWERIGSWLKGVMEVQSMRKVVWSVAASVGLGLGAISLCAQSGTPSTPTQPDNPFPAEPQKAGEPKPDAAHSQRAKPDATTAEPARPAGGNEFPGDGSDAPIIPVDPGPGNAGPGNAGSSAPAGSSAGREASRSGGGDGDPVRSPDVAGGSDDGFSSSSSGMSSTTADDDAPTPTKSTKSKTRAQEIKEDVDVGGFYLDKKNWKAAQERFSTAFALDAENPDVVWGLAEAERHLLLLDKAKEHYELFLAYDPGGPHSKAARKALEQVEQARANNLNSNLGSAKTPSNPPH
jgi:hypothetical protein